MPVTWDQDADNMLFLSILCNHEFKVDYKKVAADLAVTLNAQINAKTIQNRLFRLKSNCGKSTTKDGDSPKKASSQTSSPKKPTSQASTPRKRKKKDVMEEEVDDDVHHTIEEPEEDMENLYFGSDSDEDLDEIKKRRSLIEVTIPAQHM